MPEPENTSQPEEEALQQDQLVEQLMPDPSQGHPDVRTLVGFVGRSNQKGSVRLYLTANLDIYVEIPQDAIVHHKAVSSRETSMTGTILWVKADSTIEYYTRTSVHLRQAGFLGGNINTTPPTGKSGMTSADATALSTAGQQAVARGDVGFDLWCFLSPSCPPPRFFTGQVCQSMLLCGGLKDET